MVAAKLKCAAGLASLQNKKYKQAARRFTEVGTQHSLSSKRMVVVITKIRHSQS